MKKAAILIPLTLVIVLAMACDLPFLGGSEGSDNPAAEGECDPRSQRVMVNDHYSMHVGGGSYPNNCEVYCLWAPPGNLALEIGVGFSNTPDSYVDLDLYVDTDLSLLDASDEGQWKSDEYNTQGETVYVENPNGLYYIQVCSFTEVASDFTLTLTLMGD